MLWIKTLQKDLIQKKLDRNMQETKHTSEGKATFKKYKANESLEKKYATPEAYIIFPSDLSSQSSRCTVLFPYWDEIPGQQCYYSKKVNVVRQTD